MKYLQKVGLVVCLIALSIVVFFFSKQTSNTKKTSVVQQKSLAKIIPAAPTPTIEKMGSDITIYAAGEQALGVYPIMVLVIKGEVVKTFQDIEGNPGKREFQTFDYSSPTKVLPDDVQVQFVNDYYDPDAGQDRNLYVDKIIIDEKPYESETETVWSTGSTSPGERCTEGAKKTEELDCNGYFQYFQTK